MEELATVPNEKQQDRKQQQQQAFKPSLPRVIPTAAAAVPSKCNITAFHVVHFRDGRGQEEGEAKDPAVGQVQPRRFQRRKGEGAI